uniref:Uncharacterized protein n=1 Tax=Eptatretus burgeri TaxID=7764 RepID=A0A8C4QNU0_EPTBU
MILHKLCTWSHNELCCCCCCQAVPDAVASWEEGKRWQNKVESLRSALKEKENEVEKLKKQVSTVKELLGRVEQEKSSLQRRLRGKGMSTEPVRQRVKMQKVDHQESKQPGAQDEQKAVIKSEEQKQRKQLRSENLPSRIDPRTDELRKQVLKLSAETVTLQFEIEQTRMELPQLKDENKDLKEMCQLLMKEKTDLQEKLTTLKAGNSGRSVTELEKMVSLMRRAVEKLQRENAALRPRTPHDAHTVGDSQSSGRKSQRDPETLGRKRLTVEQPERDHNV